MRATAKLLVAALAAAGLAFAADAGAASGIARHGGGAWSGGGHSGGGRWSGGGHSGGGHWNGGHRWSGGHHWSGGHWGFYLGAPLVVGSWWWGSPYYYDYYYYPYPRETVIYREVERYPEGEFGPAAEAAPGPGSPTQGPLYMNYCESSKAYYPKVTTCAEGWRFIPPPSQPAPETPRY